MRLLYHSQMANKVTPKELQKRKDQYVVCGVPIV